MHRLLVILAWSAAIACAGRMASDRYIAERYANPERVTILGYDDDAMEPSLTRDGRYLLFNNRTDGQRFVLYRVTRQ